MHRPSVNSSSPRVAATDPPPAEAAGSADAGAPRVILPPCVFGWAVFSLLMVVLLGAIDQSIVAVVLPTIGHQLGGFEWMAWVISAYMLACTVVTPLYGRFSDLYGRLRMLQLALGLFLVGSVACALAQSMPQLVLARALQGAGGGGLIALAQTIVADIVPLRDRGRYQSHVAVVWAAASVGAPVLGGLLAQQVSWHWIFWINVPLSLAVWAIASWALRSLPVPRQRQAIDWAGIALLVPGLLAVLLPVTRIGQGLRWDTPLHLVSMAGGVALLAVLVWHERRCAAPVLALNMFRHRGVGPTAGMLFINFLIFIAMGLLIPLRLQMVGGLSTQAAAIQILPFSLGIPAAAFIGGRWMGATGRVRPLLWLGAGMVPVGLAALALTPADSLWLSSAVMIFLGLGTGFQLPATLITIQQSVPRDLLGAATGFTAFVRLLAGAAGVAVLSAAVMALLRDHLPPEAAQLGLEHLSQLLAAARQAGTSSGLSADRAFQEVYFAAGLLALVSIALAPRVPDVRVHSGAKPA